MSGLTRKVISLTFVLQNGTFGDTGANTLTVSGLQTEFSMLESGGVSRPGVHIAVYGLTPSQMNALSTYGMPPDQNFNNSVSVSAGDAVNGMSLVFQGTIYSAYADYSNQPNVKFILEANMGLFDAVKPAAPLSYSGSASVATIMGNIAKEMGLSLENSGVTAQLTNAYFPGSLDDQRKACAEAANIYATIDHVRGVLAIWPKNGYRNAEIVTIGPTTGLVGYPTFTYQGVRFTCLWNPNVVFGRRIQIVSSLAPANGIWVPANIMTELVTEVDNGPWFMSIEAYSRNAFVGGG